MPQPDDGVADGGRAEWHETIEPLYREFVAAASANARAGADRLGLGSTDLDAINVLLATGPLGAVELGDHLGLTSGSATRLVDRLEAAGYARRSADPTDRRRVRVEVVPEAATRAEQAFRPTREELMSLAPEFGPDDLRTVARWLYRGAASLRTATDRMQHRERTDGA